MLLFYQLVGSGRACAPVRCAHPSFWAHKHAKRALRPRPSQLRCSTQNKKKETTSRNKILPFRPKLGPPGRISFPWAKPHPTELHCTLLSYNALSWAMRHPNELRCTLLIYTAPYWATLHPTKLCCIQLSYAAPYLTYAAHYLSYTLHPLSFAAPFWATLHPSELCCTRSSLRCALRASLHPKSYAAP